MRAIATNLKWPALFAAAMGLGSLTAFIKFSYLHLNFTVDFWSYIDTARLFSGLPTTLEPWRVLKPLAPYFTSLLAPAAGSFEGAFLIQVAIFYFLLIAAAFLFFREFFKESLFKTAAATSLFIFSFPVLRYGLGPFTEAGAWFFYMLSLYLTLLFLSKPTLKLIILNSLALTAGFLYKEYSVVSSIIANIAILFAPEMGKRLKAQYLIALNGIFIAANSIWQYFVYTKYGYTYFDWYIDGGLSAAPIAYTLPNVLASFALVLSLAWIFVPFGIKKIRGENLPKNKKMMLLSLLSVPFLCLMWGGVDSRLFYVTAPGLIILAVSGIDSLKSKWRKLAAVAAILSANFAFLILFQFYF